MASKSVARKGGNSSQYTEAMAMDAEAKIFVRGLPWQVDERGLSGYFRGFGNVVGAEIKLDPLTGKSRGFGYVTFDAPEGVDAVVAKIGRHNLHGKNIDVKPAAAWRAKGDSAKAGGGKGLGKDAGKSIVVPALGNGKGWGKDAGCGGGWAGGTDAGYGEGKDAGYGAAKGKGGGKAGGESGGEQETIVDNAKKVARSSKVNNSTMELNSVPFEDWCADMSASKKELTPLQISKGIHKATTPEKVLRIVKYELGNRNFNARIAASALGMLVNFDTLTGTEKELCDLLGSLEDLVDRSEMEGTLRPKDLALTLSNLAKLIVHKLPYMPDGGLDLRLIFGSLCRKAQTMAKDFNGQDLATIMWAIAKTGLQVPQLQPVFAALCDAAMTKVNDFDEQAVANIM